MESHKSHAGLPGACSWLLVPPTRKEKQARMDGLLRCRQRPLGGLNSHCYVIPSHMGLVGLWIVGGLSTVISQALSVSQNQPLLRAGLSSNPCRSTTNRLFHFSITDKLVFPRALSKHAQDQFRCFPTSHDFLHLSFCCTGAVRVRAERWLCQVNDLRPQLPKE